MERVVGRASPLWSDRRRFVGRQAELILVARFLDDVRLGHTGLLLVEAEAGAGKTSLLRHATDSAVMGSAFSVFAADGDPNDSRALRCITDALDCRVTSDDPMKVRIAELQRTPASAAAGSTLAAIEELVLDAIEREAMSSPTLLVIDDLQWVDDTSLVLLGSLLRRLRGTNFGVLAASRPSARVRAILAPMRAREVILGPLNDGEVAEIVEMHSGAAPTAAMMASLSPLRSNPFLLSVLAGSSTERGAEAVPADGAALDALRSLTDGMEPDLRRFLEFAAVGGRELDVDALAAAADHPLAHVVRLTGECTLRGWLSGDGEAVTFRHELLVEFLVSIVPLDERDRIHLALGRAFARLGHAPGRAAFHLDAASYLLGPSDTALLRTLLNELAIDDFVALALAELAHTLDPSDVDVLCVLMKCLSVRHRHVEAVDHAQRWLTLAGVEVSRGRVQLLAATSMVATVGGDAVVAFLDQLVHGTTLDPGQRAEALNAITRLHWHRRDASLVRSSATQALDASRAAGSAYGEVLALCSRSEASSLLGEVDDALTDANTAQAIVAAESLLTAVPALALGTALSTAGRMSEGLPILTQSLRIAERAGDPQAMVLAQVTMQATRFHIGSWDAYVADADAMAEIGHDTNMRAGVVLPLGFAAASAVRSGRFADVSVIAARARAEFTMGDSHPGAIIGIGFIELAQLESNGQLAEACRYAAAFAQMLAPAGASAQNLVVVDAARLAWQVGDAETLAIADGIAGYAASISPTPTRLAIGNLLAALAGDDVMALVDAACAVANTERAWDGATSLHMAGIDAARAGFNRAPELLADAASRYAALGCHHHAGIAAAGLGFDALFSDALAAPDLADAVALSPAEQRVLALVIDGLPNGDIADALFVSKRTVESHLGSLYRKLGVTTRVALTRAGATFDQGLKW